jgi:hypothetical protein
VRWEAFLVLAWGRQAPALFVAVSWNYLPPPGFHGLVGHLAFGHRLGRQEQLGYFQRTFDRLSHIAGARQ